MYPKTKVLSNKQGFSRSYNVFPYGDYKNDDEFLLFPISKKDTRIRNKERVHAVLNNKNAKVFRFNSFVGGKVVGTSFLTDNILVVGNNEFIHSYILKRCTH